ncbi:MAG: hypothetical protein WCP09_01490 [Candidatus Taylorbacteria bacterium]
MNEKQRKYLLLASVMFTMAICMATAIWKSVSDSGIPQVKSEVASEVSTSQEATAPQSVPAAAAQKATVVTGTVAGGFK